MRIILADTETTGVGTADKICEIAWKEITPEFEVVRSGDSLINPEREIAAAASAVNGITNAMVADAPTIDQYMEAFKYPLMGDDVVMIAHNVSFDYRFLKPYMSDGCQLIDTLRCARLLYPNAENHKQSTLAYMFGFNIDRSKAHSADGDLDVLLQLVRKITDDLQCSILDLLSFQKQPRPIAAMPFGKHKGVPLKDLPSQYVQWLFKLDNLDPDLRTALEAL